jgi:hypothetical protein
MTAPRTPLLVTVVAVGALVLSACGAGSGSPAAADNDNELATLETADEPDSAVSSAPEAAAESELAADEAALALSECLRGEGIDIPDIGTDADGNIDLRGALADVAPGDGGFRDAIQACRETLDGVQFGGGRGGRGAIADNTEIQDAFLELSDCIRDNGFEDIPDLTFGGPGGGDGGANAGQGDGTPPAGGQGPGQGNRDGGFGDRSTLIAERLGLDAEDPAVIEALDACLPILDQAFTDAGIGQPRAGA